MSNTLSISLFGVTVYLETDCIELIQLLLEKQRLFNYKAKIRECTPISGVWTLIYYNRTCKKIEYASSKKQVIVSRPWNEINKSTYLRCILLTLVDLSLQEENKVLLHSSAVSYNNKGYLFIGGSNSGKTTLAMLFCSKHGAKFISSDLTVVSLHGSDCYLENGNVLMNLRPHSVKMTDPKLYEKVFPDNSHSKKRIDARDYLQVEENLPLRCEYMIFVNTYLESDQANVRLLETKDLLLTKSRMYNQISETIRGNKYLLFDNEMRIFDEQIRYMDKPVFQQMRTSLVECLFESSTGIYSEGNPELVLNQLLSMRGTEHVKTFK